VEKYFSALASEKLSGLSNKIDSTAFWIFFSAVLDDISLLI